MIHLHVHSNYSLLEGAATVQQLVARAVEYGMSALALTDTHGLHGAIEFYRKATAAGIKPILGVQLGNEFLARGTVTFATLCAFFATAHILFHSSDARTKHA